jgi:hypothetical protein
MPKSFDFESKEREIYDLFDSQTQSLLEYLCSNQGISVREALSNAIITETYLREEIKQGGVILVQKADGDLHEVIMKGAK